MNIHSLGCSRGFTWPRPRTCTGYDGKKRLAPVAASVPSAQKLSVWLAVAALEPVEDVPQTCSWTRRPRISNSPNTRKKLQPLTRPRWVSSPPAGSRSWRDKFRVGRGMMIEPWSPDDCLFDEFDLCCLASSYATEVPRPATVPKPWRGSEDAPINSKLPQPRNQIAVEDSNEVALAVFSSLGPECPSVCRGEVGSLLATRACMSDALAQKQRKCHSELAQVHRTKASKWRSLNLKKDAKMKTTPKTVFSDNNARTHPNLEKDSIPEAAEEVNEEPKFEEPEEDIAAHIHKTCTGNYRMQSRPTLQISAYQEHLRNVMLSEKQDGSHKVKAAIALRLKMRRVHTKKLVQIKRKREKHAANVPTEELEAHHEAFAIYADESGTIPAADIIRCLAELGLAGKTRHERWAVEKMCKKIYDALVQEIQIPEPEKTAECKSRRLTRAITAARLAGKKGRSIAEALAEVARDQGSMHKTKSMFNCIKTGTLSAQESELRISFEDLEAEVIPSVMDQICSIRQEAHFSEYLRVLSLKDSDSLYLTAEEFLEIADCHDLDSEIAEEALEALNRVRCEKDEGSEPIVTSSLDADALHELLMHVEQATDRKRRRIEQAIRENVGLTDEFFWRYRPELIKLYETFHHYDDDEDECITHIEAKLLLKHLGFQPYREGPEAENVQNILEETDEDGNGVVDFLEFVGLMERIREDQRARRRLQLIEEFKKYLPTDDLIKPISKQVVELKMHEIADLLKSCGIFLGSGDFNMIRRVADQINLDFAALTLADLENIAQKVAESLQSSAADGILALVDDLGLGMKTFADYQAAFDQFVPNRTDCITYDQLVLTVVQRIGREPTNAEMVDVLFGIKKDVNGMYTIEDFMRILHFVSSTLTKGVQFTLKEVPSRKLREILQGFRLAQTYIMNLSFEDLIEHAANYLEVRPNSDLSQELPERITNPRQLAAYASKKAAMMNVPGTVADNKGRQ